MIAAVVLAAGAGSRFSADTHKLLAPFRGRPLIVWAVEHALSAGLDAVAVVVGAVSLGHVLPAGVSLIPNGRWAEGQASSLQAAVSWADLRSFDAVAVGLGDQPLVPPEVWTAVAAGDGFHPIAVASYGGRRGNPVRLDREVWPLLPTTGDAGARVLMRERPELVGEIPCDGAALDIDTVEDLDGWS
ncbi:MAG: nucleotidyltransferase family protein [Acidimicrobiales bacterium]